MTQRQVYIERLADNMKSAGQSNWSKYDMSDISELAGLWKEWLKTKNRHEEENLALQAAKILGVEIRRLSK